MTSVRIVALSSLSSPPTESHIVARPVFWHRPGRSHRVSRFKGFCNLRMGCEGKLCSKYSMNYASLPRLGEGTAGRACSIRRKCGPAGELVARTGRECAERLIVPDRPFVLSARAGRLGSGLSLTSRIYVNSNRLTNLNRTAKTCRKWSGPLCNQVGSMTTDPSACVYRLTRSSILADHSQ